MKSKEEDIIEAAVRLFSEKGYTATSVDEIAKESGMAKASFYKFFQSKEDVLIATVKAHSQIVEEHIFRFYASAEVEPLQKIARFIQVHMESTLESKIHSVMMSVHDKSILQNEKLLEECLRLEFRLNQWSTDCLVDIYGDKVKPYVYDIIFLIRGLLMQYMFLPVIGVKSNLDQSELSGYLARMVDWMAASMFDHGYKPIWNCQEMQIGQQDIQDSPVFKGIMIHELLLSLKRSLHHLHLPDEEKEETWQVLSTLEQEITAERLRSGLIKAMLQFLEQQPVFAEDCARLKKILAV
ncbi:TetR/AcrR family transcriptional regulator [Paenibacillus sp. Z6-24]